MAQRAFNVQCMSMFERGEATEAREATGADENMTNTATNATGTRLFEYGTR